MTTMSKITYTKEDVNEMRLTMSDQAISHRLNITMKTINSIYWSREENNIPYFRKNYVLKSWKRSYVEERVLKTDKWEYNTDKPYWDTNTEIELYNKPASFTRFNQNSLWTSVH